MLRLLLPFLLVAITSVSHALSFTSWEINEEWEDDKWTLEATDDQNNYVEISVNGQFIKGDRLSLIMKPSEGCDNSMMAASFYTRMLDPEFADIENQKISIEAFGVEMPAHITHFTEMPHFGAYLGWIQLFFTEVEEMKEMLQLITEEFDAMQITLKPTEDFKVDQHFDRLTNRWSMVGVSEAFDKTVTLCNRISEDIII